MAKSTAFQFENLMPVRELKVRGAHNQANALAALALGHAVGLPFDAMLASLREFTGLEHRCQWLREREGVHYYNDSKATNVGLHWRPSKASARTSTASWC